VTIEPKEGILRMTGGGLVLLPLDEEGALIVGGPFAYERLVRDPATGVIEWGSRRYVPVR
jgi:hypothetical protein